MAQRKEVHDMSMRKVIDYDLVVESIEDGVDEFKAEVKEKLAEGWYPWGAPFEGGKDRSYMKQALVKYGDPL
jgi:hypothetical protein